MKTIEIEDGTTNVWYYYRPWVNVGFIVIENDDDLKELSCLDFSSEKGAFDDDRIIGRVRGEGGFWLPVVFAETYKGIPLNREEICLNAVRQYFS